MGVSRMALKVTFRMTWMTCEECDVPVYRMGTSGSGSMHADEWAMVDELMGVDADVYDCSSCMGAVQ